METRGGGQPERGREREGRERFKKEERAGLVVRKKRGKKISLATVYNTVEAFKKAGHIKQILTSKSKSYFDTNIKSHHHFYDEDSKELTDIHYNQVKLSKVPNPPKGKKIKNLEVVIRLQK